MKRNSISKKCNKIIDNFYDNNDYLSLNDLLLKKECKKAFKNIIFSNLKKNNFIKKNECLICYDTKTYKYKVICCDKQFICLECLDKIFNSKNFKCLFCHKNLYDNFLDDIRKGMISLMNKELELKIYERKKEILNGPHIEGEMKRKRQILLDKFISLLLYNNYVIEDIKKIQFIDYFSFEVTMKNGNVLFIMNKNDRIYLNNNTLTNSEPLIHYEPQIDSNLVVLY